MPVTTIDIDTGGTFTDGFIVRDGVAHMVKTLTTPHDLALCFRAAIEAAADQLGLTVPDLLRETVSVRYATTVGTNTVLQRTGPRLGLLTDDPAIASGGDGIGIGTFVPPEMVATVPTDGQRDTDTALAPLPVIRELLQNGARGLVAACSGDGAERALAATFADHYPRHCLDSVPLLLAGGLAPAGDPVRGAATALFNAYVHPDVADYLYRAEDFLRQSGYTRPLRVVHNDGGAARVARTIAGKTYNSGPAAGMLGARTVAAHYGIDDLVTLDMGGTSLDVGILRDGEVPMREPGVVAGVEIGFPLPDLIPLGLGGGSIAWLDGSTVRVGPRSAGARPGPACFCFGGVEPTVTDADVVLGVLRPGSFLGGDMEISTDAARHAFESIAGRLGCTVEQAAARVLATAHGEVGARIAGELRDRGVDPARVTALAFGGNGATHGAAIAAAAGIGDVLVMPFAPVFSAYGASAVDIRHRHEAPAAETDTGALRGRVLRDMRGEGVAVDDVSLVEHEFVRAGVRWLAVEGTHQLPHATLDAPQTAARGCAARGTRSVYWPDEGSQETTVVSRGELGAGDVVPGPALVDARDTTCAVPPGWTLTVDEHGASRLRAGTPRSER